MSAKSYFEIDVSSISPDEKHKLYDVLEKNAFMFDEAGIGWRVDSFHFMPTQDWNVDELRERYLIPLSCPVRPYFHPL